MDKIDYNRIMEENGSSNYSVFVHDGLCYFINQDYSVYRANDNIEENIIAEPVGAFQIGKQYQRIFYQTEDNSLWVCQLDGSQKQRILGGNGDEVRSFVVNDEFVFIVVESSKGEQYLYQLSQNLQNVSILRQTTAQLRLGCADHQHLYYHFFSDVNQHTLIQHNIQSKMETILLNNIGIRDVQLYQNNLVMQQFKNCMSPYDKPEIVILDTRSKSLRSLTAVHAKEINCYLDHVFYVPKNSETVWAIPFSGGTPHQIWRRPVDILNLSMGCMFFIDCADRSMKRIPLADNNAAEPTLPEAAVESIKGNYILQDDPLSYLGKTAEDVLNELVPDYPFERETYDYVVFLTLPHLNKSIENIPTLLDIGGYKPKQRSTPILFVDSTLTHSRKKGFIVATDGIYTPQTFFPYDYTFVCERSGIQELTVQTFQRVRYGNTRSSLRLNCPMYKDGLDDVAALVEVVYVFSYFTQSDEQNNYHFPLPVKKASSAPVPHDELARGEFFEWDDELESESTPIVAVEQSNTKEELTYSKPDIESIGTADDAEQRFERSDTTSDTYGGSAELHILTETAFKAAMDALWKPETLRLICYNVFKFLLTTLWFTVWIPLFAYDHAVWAVISFVGGAFLILIILILLQMILQTPKMKQLEEQYNDLGIDTLYTPIGFRGKMFVVMLIISFTLGFLISVAYCNFVLS